MIVDGLHVDDGGAGTAVILHAGLGCDAGVWRGQVLSLRPQTPDEMRAAFDGMLGPHAKPSTREYVLDAPEETTALIEAALA